MKINWPTKKLGKVCYFEGGKQPPKIHFIDQPKNGYIRLIQIRDFRSDDKAVYIPKELAKNWVDKDDILISRYGGFRNYKSFFNILTGKSGAFNVALIKVIPDESLVNKKFIYFQLQLPRYKNILIKKSDRAVQSGFRRKDLENLEVVIPPLSIQQKIVKRLDIIIKTQELNEKQISLTNELFQSLLNQELKPRKSWKIIRLKEVIIDLTNGFASRPVSKTKGISQIRPHNISNDGFITLGGIKFVPESIKNLEKYFLKKGDILFNNTNSIKLVGKTAYVNQDYRIVFSNHITRIRTKENIINSYFLSVFLNYIYFLGKFRSLCTPWVNQAGINNEILKNLKIPTPRLETQHKIIEKLSAIQNYKKKLLKQKELLQELFESTLNKAMKGELVK